MKLMKRFVFAVVVAVPLGSASAQATDSTNVPTYQRSELAATALAWIAPGLGHLYAEDRRRGEVILVVGSLTFVAFTWAMIDVARTTAGSSPVGQLTRLGTQTLRQRWLASD